ncbi:hypothetical protein AKJ57_06535 [candidate division MSBL1 archaeon SCGC-AAA259A05]|uniref:NADH-quinone oxidoreductase subunit J n=1 Tax=candidate division MSBL1 archaeon SCGC-AAA259A05 TaxID=1698259 RepID=A0A133U388_9EURY|nr:hypothetical protein AKJ57_06535 [candidate division MSBL1 archaeon SCGC-AAA259A05]
MIDLLVFSVLSITTIVFSLLVVLQPTLIYSAISLGFLGMANAALFMLLGFPFVGLFHLTVYIGAAVVFILLAATMFKRAPPVEFKVRSLAIIIAFLLAFSLAVVFWSYSEVPLSPGSFSLKNLSNLFVEDYWFPLLVTALALVTTLVEGITLARREAG